MTEYRAALPGPHRNHTESQVRGGESSVCLPVAVPTESVNTAGGQAEMTCSVLWAESHPPRNTQRCTQAEIKELFMHLSS